MAAAVRTPVPFMAISLQAPSNSTRTSVMPSAKSDFKAAGRRKLEKFKAARKQGEPKPVEAPRRADSNGELEAAAAVVVRKDSIAALDETSFPEVSSSGIEVEAEASSDSNVHSFVNLPPDPPPTFSTSSGPPTFTSESFITSENHLSDRDVESEKENRSSNIMDHFRDREAPRSRDSLFNFRPAVELDSRLASAEENLMPRAEELLDSRISDENFVPKVGGPENVFSSFSAIPRHNSFVTLDMDPVPLSSSKDDFAALEQHIEDLTQEKFSLQRGLEKTRALVETLSHDNSALTEDYNQQAAKVDELRDEVSRCQELIRSQEIVIRSLKAEKDKSHQECTIASERARTFAAEVVGLEEKCLKMRSQELKVQKEAESLRAEIESCRKQLLSIEKDRANAISVNDALQEEKKLLLARIREAAFDKPVTPQVTQQAPVPKEDASTSTDDLVTEDESSNETVSGEEETTSYTYPTSLPPDHLGIIESINNLVTELGQEKNELLRALRNEVNTVAQLKGENVELSQRLERQTQQLELAFAQNLARAGGSSLLSPSVSQASEEVEYIDEGDEVVDRVLGWIMRLFPGKRGSSKQL